jgi:carbamoylphosphate synthase large subunit
VTKTSVRTRQTLPAPNSRRLLITSAGNGAGNNVIRSLRAGDSSLRLVGCHSDRFILKTSAADRQYLVPARSHPAYADAIRRVVAAEKIDLVIPITDVDVRVVSRLRAKIPCRVFLPRSATIRLCQDKYVLSRFLRERGVPAPATFVVTDLAQVTGLFRRLPFHSRLWCRIRTESGAMGAIPVENPAQTRSWIRYWRAMRGVPVTSFTLSEYLPGRDLGCQALWKDGTLILVKTYERLSYLAMGALPSQISSVAILSKTTREPRVVDICTRAIRSLDPKVSGVFSMDLRENADGVPCVTDINAGRFSSATNIFDLTGKHNMATTYVSLALGDPVELRDEYDVADDHYMVRDVDAPPSVFHADDFFDGIREVQARRRERS